MLTFNAEKHIYELNGARVPSVTELIPKPDFSFVDPAVLENARQEGVALHGKIETYFAYGDTFDDIILEDLDRLLKDNAELLGAFKCSEKYFGAFNGGLSFAGKPDAVYENAIIDFKRTPPDKSIAALQFSGYEALLIENKVLDDCVDNWLLCYMTKTGWRFKNVYNKYASDIFDCCLRRWYDKRDIDAYINNKGLNYE